MAKSKQKNQTKPPDVTEDSAATHPEAAAAVSTPPTVSTPAVNITVGTTPTNPAPARNSSILPVLIPALATIIVAVISSPLWFQSIQSFFQPTPTPTATPIPFAQIQSLDVIHAGGSTETVDPDKNFVLPAGSNVNVRVHVISNIPVEDLVFLWDFCDSVNDVRGQGASEIPYRLRANGQDCITVKIEGGGAILDTAYFFVTIE